MPITSPTGRIRRRAASAAGIIAALAIAAPATEASAATPTLPSLPVPALPAVPALGPLPALTPAPLSFVGPSVGAIGVAIGPTVIGSVFNGGTTVCVSALTSACSTNASP